MNKDFQAALNMIADWGVPIEKVKFMAILASQRGLESIGKEFPELEVLAIAFRTKNRQLLLNRSGFVLSIISSLPMD